MLRRHWKGRSILIAVKHPDTINNIITDFYGKNNGENKFTCKKFRHHYFITMFIPLTSLLAPPPFPLTLLCKQVYSKLQLWTIKKA